MLNRTSVQTCLSISIIVLVVSFIIFASPIGGVGIGFASDSVGTGLPDESVSHGEFAAEENGDNGEGGENETEVYGPDITIPDNDFVVFYSEKDNPELEEMKNISDTHPNITSTGMFSLLNDSEYRVTDGLFTVNGWSFGEYRANQLYGHEWPVNKSYKIGKYDEMEEDGMIRDAYIAPVRVHGGSETDFVFPSEYDEIIGNQANLLTYTDFYIDQDESEEEIRDAPITHTGGSYPTDRVGSPGDLYDQTQRMETYHAEQYRLSTETYMYGDESDSFLGTISYNGTPAKITNETFAEVQQTTANQSSGDAFNLGGVVEGVSGRTIFEYNATDNSEVRFESNSELEVDRGEYEWHRERDRVHGEFDAEIKAVEEVTETAWVHADANNENTSTATADCSTNVESFDVEREPEFTITRLDRDRRFTVEKEVTISVGGEIEGTCTGDVGEEGGSGWISDSITDDVEGSSTEIFQYDYWEHWNTEYETDIGGWNITSREIDRTDDIRVTSEPYNTYNTDNNYVNVSQLAVQADENTYHSIVSIDYENDHVFGHNDMEEMYYWSMLMFGDGTFVKSPWGAYSTTEYGGEETPMSGYDTETDHGEFPRQVGVNVFSGVTRPELVSRSDWVARSPELYGWDGFVSSHGEDAVPDVDSRTTFENDVAVFTDMVAVKDAPRPASELVSIHGGVVEIEEEDTEMIPYEEPNVDLQRDDENSSMTVTVTGVGDEPLSGRNILVESGPEEPGEFTTNEDGKIQFNTSDRLAHIQLTVEGDDISDLIEEPDRDVFYGSVVVEKSSSGSEFGVGGVISELYDLIVAVLFAGPLILYYLYWRDTRLAE